MKSTIVIDPRLIEFVLKARTEGLEVMTEEDGSIRYSSDGNRVYVKVYFLSSGSANSRWGIAEFFERTKADEMADFCRKHARNSRSTEYFVVPSIKFLEADDIERYLSSRI